MVYALDNEMAYKCLTEYSGRPMVVGGTDCTFYSAWYSGNPGYNSLGFKDAPKLTSTTIIAGKTGYVDEAGFTFVTVSQDKSGQRYVNVTVGKPKGEGYTATKFMTDVKSIYNTYAK
jgi:D-alanyl-D-alanine carboxypeptidase